MSACRSVLAEPLAPLVEHLQGETVKEIQRVMFEVMPILSAPQGKKQKLIDQLVAFVLGSESLADVLAAVCTSALENLTVDMIHRLLRQWDPKSKWKRVRKPMIEHFIQLNMPQVDGNLHDDGPCLTVVPYVADCGAPTADCHAQVVDYESSGRKMRKTQRKMYKTWLKGARLLRRKKLSKAIAAELMWCLRDNEKKDWSVAKLRAHVSFLVDKPLHSGHARVFFQKKLQEILLMKRKKRRQKRAKPIHADFAVPKKRLTVIADAEQWREMRAMHTQDVRI